MKSKKSNTVSCKLTTVIMSFLAILTLVYYVTFASHSDGITVSKTSIQEDYDSDIHKASQELMLLIENVKYHSNAMKAKPEAHAEVIPKIMKLMDVASSVEELLGHIHVQADQYSLQYPTQLDSLYSTLLVESKSLEELAENIVKDKKSKTPIKQLRGTAEAVPDAVPLVHTKPSNLDNFVKFTSNQMEHTKPTEPVVNPTTTFVPNTIQVNAVGTALLVICSSHRPDYLQRTLSYVLKFHPRIGFPIIISEDGASPKVKSIIDTFRKEIQCTSVDINHEGGFERSKLYMPSSTTITDGTAVPVVHLHHPMSHERAENGYFKLSKHFKYALGVVFDHNSHESFAQFQSMPSPYLSGQMLISPIGFQRVIILEEDIQISPDFFEYFSSVTNMVDNDETILCASAWNDNGFSSLINPTVDRDKLVRSDFFPGLGWMLTKKLWVNELCAKWPRAYWDDWLREPPQRKNRHTIRPEICRTYHFGAKGVSGGQYNSYLNDISLNEQFQPFTSLNLDYLEETAWNSDKYMNLVRNSEIVTKQTFPVKRDEILNRKLNAEQSLRIIYTSLDGREPTSFVSLAKWLKCMDNIKAHVPRTAYKGIVSLWKEGVKLHITPAAI